MRPETRSNPREKAFDILVLDRQLQEAGSVSGFTVEPTLEETNERRRGYIVKDLEGNKVGNVFFISNSDMTVTQVLFDPYRKVDQATGGVRMFYLNHPEANNPNYTSFDPIVPLAEVPLYLETELARWKN